MNVFTQNFALDSSLNQLTQLLSVVHASYVRRVHASLETKPICYFAT